MKRTIFEDIIVSQRVNYVETKNKRLSCMYLNEGEIRPTVLGSNYEREISARTEIFFY